MNNKIYKTFEMRNREKKLVIPLLTNKIYKIIQLFNNKI